MSDSYRQHLRRVRARRSREIAFHAFLASMLALDLWLMGKALGLIAATVWP